MTLGVWVQLPPGAEWSGEGLTRLLSFVAEGADPEKVRIRIFVPRWMRETVEEDAKTWGENSRRVVKVETVPGKMPFLLRRHLAGPRPEKQSAQEVRPSLEQRLVAFAQRQWNSPWRVPTIIAAVLLMPLWMLLGLVVLPAIAVVRSAVRLPLWRRIGQFLASPFAEIHSAIKRGLAYIKQQLPVYVVHDEFERMARHANRMKVDVWYVGYPGFTLAEKLKAPLVVMFADFVVGEFPHLFPPVVLENARAQFSVLVPHTTRYITISKHVAEDFVIGEFKVPRERVVTIPHAPPSLVADAPYLPENGYRTVQSRKEAADIIRRHCADTADAWPAKGPLTEQLVLPYLQDFPFEHIDYVLISTQNRPYKNTIAAIKAVEELNRRRNRPVKVIMTGDVGLDDPNSVNGAYVRDKLLHFDAISIPRVPREVHAALYHGALAAVQPTFYEGGAGSWIFFEALSVGTPALVSRNASSLEMDFDAAFKERLFDPVDIGQIADQIEEVLDDREAVYAMQMEWYRSHLDRTWGVVSSEYMAVFRDAMESGRIRNGT